MKERLLVLAKAAPEVSSKYESLICIAGITDKGEWRRIYPIPWKAFWRSSNQNFRKKTWIEYELQNDKPSDHRPESRKIRFETIKPCEEATFGEIEKLLRDKLTTIEKLEEKGTKTQSLGVIEPTELLDFGPTTNQHYEALVTKTKQTTLTGEKAVKLDIPKFKYRYLFKDDIEGRVHENLCEDWEVAELYRKCEQMRSEGKYKDENEVHQKIKDKMFGSIMKNKHIYFIVGSHFRFPTYMIVGIIYPKKTDLLD